MALRLLLIFTVVLSFTAIAGDITIDKRDSAIRNDIFDDKRQRAEEYKENERQREINNQAWSYELPLGCGLFRRQYLTYSCADGRYFRGEESGARRQYRELSRSEIEVLNRKKK